MRAKEFSSIFAALLILFVVAGMRDILNGTYEKVIEIFIFSFIIICLPILAKKGTATLLDASVEHKIWFVEKLGISPRSKLKKPWPFGLVIPLLASLISLGAYKVLTLLTYETSALKKRAAKRHGYYSYTEITDWHNGLIGATGIITLFLITIIGYLAGFETLSKISAYFAFWNMIPISKLDGTQIFFGNRLLWTILGIITLIFTLYAFVLSF